MQQDWVEDIWSRMQIGKYYSVRDLANLTNQPSTVIIDSMKFLSEYGFVRSFAQAALFAKTGSLSPSKSAQLLTSMIQPSMRSVQSSPTQSPRFQSSCKLTKW